MSIVKYITDIHTGSFVQTASYVIDSASFDYRISSSTLQRVLDNGSTFDKDNTIDAAGYYLEISDVDYFDVSAENLRLEAITGPSAMKLLISPTAATLTKDNGTPSNILTDYSVDTVSSTTYTETSTYGERILLVDAGTAGGNVTINIPDALDSKLKLTVKKIDSGSYSVIVTGSQNIDSYNNQVLNYFNTAITIISNKVDNWYKI